MNENIKKSMREILDSARRDVEKIFEETELKINTINNPFNLSLGEEILIKEGVYKGEVCTISDISSCGEMVDVRELPTSFVWHFDVKEFRKLTDESSDKGKWSAKFFHDESDRLIIDSELVSSEKKTVNQQRAELIEQAKAFVERHTEKEKTNRFNAPCFSRHGFGLVEDFIVNKEKRTVVCLLRGVETRKVRLKGIAKCILNEVFNEWIGKAIALARALDIDVPQEFLDAVQPNRIVAGMRIQGATTRYPEEALVRTCLSIESPNVYTEESGGERWLYELYTKFIDDTNAEYEQVDNK